jgi:transposase
VIKPGEAIMILELHHQGVSISAIARRLGTDRKTVRKHIVRGLEPPLYGPRPPKPAALDPFLPYLRERVAAWPELSGKRLWRELKERGFAGCYSAVTDALRDLRPPAAPAGFEVRFETPPGQQAQVDFAQFQVAFTEEPGLTRIVWLFSLVLGYSRLIWARFVLHQDLQTVLRCHIAAFEALGGVPREILYDRMKTAVLDEDEQGIVYNRSLLDLARHYGFHPRACKPYRAKTKGLSAALTSRRGIGRSPMVERPFRYVREDFFLASTFRDLDDLNAQLRPYRPASAGRLPAAPDRQLC